MRIDELHLWSGNLAIQDSFYGNLLGLPVVSRMVNKMVFQAGDSLLTFQQARSDWDGFYHFAFNIPENQFREAKDWLSTRVALIQDRQGKDTFQFVAWQADAMYFYDPAGNIVEFIARHQLDSRLSRPFDGQSLRSISEIGIPTNDVKPMVQRLCTRLSARVYDGADSDEFTAVGDAHGLLIVVKQGRQWFPDTGKTARYSQQTVWVRDAAGQRQSLSDELTPVDQQDAHR